MWLFLTIIHSFICEYVLERTWVTSDSATDLWWICLTMNQTDSTATGFLQSCSVNDFAEIGNKREKFSLWKQRMILFSQIMVKNDSDLAPFMLQGLDNDGLKIYNAFDLTTEQQNKLEYIFMKFEERLQIKTKFQSSQA